MLWFLVILFLIFLVGLALFLIFILDSLILGHDLPTSRKALKEIKKIINKYAPKASNFYDLGCGRGTVVIYVKKHFPNFQVFGLDKNPRRLFFAKLKSLILRQKVKFVYQDILDINLSSADIIYTYLWYDLMPILKEKFIKELKPGTLVITNTSNLAGIKPKEIICAHQNLADANFEKLFIYQF